MKCPKLIVSLALVLTLSSCVGAVAGVAVDTTAAVVKALFHLASAVVGVAANTTGTVIAAPFRMANAAVGGTRHGGQEGHDRPIVITVRPIKMASLGTSTFIYRQLMKPMAIQMSAS